MKIKDLETYLQTINPAIKLKKGPDFHWSPKDQVISYKLITSKDIQDWSLLHEAGHAILNHQNFTNDFNLLDKELQAWEKAKRISKHFNLKIDQNHIENCLDTYRDWLDRRSQCPKCGLKSIQQANQLTYHCYNCQSDWQVSDSRHHRSYRIQKFN